MKQRPTTAKIPINLDSNEIQQLYELDIELGRQYQLIGSNLSHFVILSELGKGSFGVVYKVKSTQDGLIYVLKKINLTHLKPKHQAEALKEAQLLRKLKHPNIITYYVSFIEQDNLCIIMEYAEGGDLQKLLKEYKEKRKSFKETTIWKISKELTQAIQHLHDNNIIHRDIKSLNVFLTKDKHVKLGDLGVSKIFNSEIALNGTRVGTPLYLAPELVQHEPYDYKVDVWALGCIIFQLATHEPPFQGDNLIALGYSIVNHPPKHLPSQYTNQLSQFISKLLEKNPQHRPTISQINNLFFQQQCQQQTNQTQAHSQSIPIKNLKHFSRPSTGNPNQQITTSNILEIDKINKIKRSILQEDSNSDNLQNYEQINQSQKQLESDKILKAQQHFKIIQKQQEKLEKEKFEREKLQQERQMKIENYEQAKIEKQKQHLFLQKEEQKFNRIDKSLNQKQIQLESNDNEYLLQKPIQQFQQNNIKLIVEDFDIKSSSEDQKCSLSVEKNSQLKIKLQKHSNTYQSNIQIRPLSAQARSQFVNISCKSKLIPVQHNKSAQETKKFTILDLNPKSNQNSFHQEIQNNQLSIINQPDSNSQQNVNKIYNKEIQINKTKENIRLKSTFILQNIHKKFKNSSQEQCNQQIVKHYTLKDLEE
ncbi:unnamed protein product [Paramecium sonneborni]|uniref:non-specific serine/threonine protein kinase n=1 Tax=Paramecium sonneborni TaxID=65129 RepID=A0A8S1PM84_9CILI|nr:unnamed protein product [Paramecium sonneborni]